MRLAREHIETAKRAFDELGIGEVRDSSPPQDDWHAPNGPEDYGLSADTGGAVGEGQDQDEQPAVPLTLICPPAWRGIAIPPMRWLATNRIPAGDVTILSGDGGGGKTTVALQLAVSVERGLAACRTEV
jgi:Mrp family chromosome partitioning ATPase